MKNFRILFIISIFVFFVSMAYAQTGTISVEISDIDELKGLMSIGLFTDEEAFPDKGNEYRGADVEVTGKTVVYTFEDVPFGSYAIAIFHDTNSNGVLDKNFLGIPKEGYAFSNNEFRAFRRPPLYEKALFKVDGDMTVKIKVEY